MLFKTPEEEDAPDFFDGPDLPDTPAKPKEPKAPRLSPDNPDYWEQTESEFAHLLPHHPRRLTFLIWIAAALMIIAVGVGFWLRYIHPASVDGRQYGYVESIEYRGTVVRTYEGTLLPLHELTDTTRLYRRDFNFTAGSKEVAYALRDSMTKGVPVYVEYTTYHATLPWRGSSRIVIESILPSDSIPH